MYKRNSGLAITACICLLLIMGVLWIYYSTMFGEKKQEKKKEISVVLYYNGTNGWESLMQGLKQAENDFSVNINYVTAKDGMSGEEQMALVQREIEGGAQGILLAASDSATDYQENWTEGIPVPIITIESGLDKSSYSHVSADDYAMGKALGEALLADLLKDGKVPIYIVDKDVKRDSVRKRANGFYDALGENIAIQKTDREAAVIVALCKETLQQVCETDEYFSMGKHIYGIGNTPSIVAAVDKGHIEKMIFQNEFNIGYLGVKKLLDEMNGIYGEMNEIDFFCVGEEDIYETPYEQLLFPIVE